MAEFEGKTALVTGAAQGIGWAIAKAFSDGGARVVLTDVNDVELARRGTELEELGREVLTLKSDVRNLQDAERVVSESVSRFGGLDVLVNNAGITRDKLFLRMKEEDWTRVVEVNLLGAINFSKAALSPMMKQRAGVIVNLSSVSGITGNPGQTNYAASKAGLIGFTKSLAKEVGARNIRVLAVAPGFVQTAMTDALPEEVRETYLSRIPLRRFGTTEDVAELTLFLCSDRAGYLTGQVIALDGGMT
jgi:3-oxoacyl-[acyl-carrier protein] reductase